MVPQTAIESFRLNYENRVEKSREFWGCGLPLALGKLMCTLTDWNLCPRNQPRRQLRGKNFGQLLFELSESKLVVQTLIAR